MDREHEQSERNGSGHHERTVSIDGREVKVSGHDTTGRTLLQAAGKGPPDEFIIYRLGSDNVLSDLGLDHPVHLEGRENDRFLTFRSDRSYRFELDGKREDWGCPTITEETLRKLAGADTDSRVWLERREQPDRLLHPGESVDLAAPGTEKFSVERKLSVEIVNEENGDDFRLKAFKETKLQTLIEEMYVRLGVPRRGDDRLRCEETGEDVFGYAHLTLGQYLEAGHCRCLVWCFVGGTGGASCR